jgi:DNA-binding response OmpR family regulator
MAPHADILLVEDEPDIIDFMERYLRRAGYSVRVVMDGATALAVLADDAPDVMILDLVLPLMSGWAVLEQLHREQYHVPVIVMTANPRVSSGLSSYGIQQCLLKPFLMAELLDAIADVYSAQPHR